MSLDSKLDWGVFHDGGISDLSIEGDSLLIQVDVEYLTDIFVPKITHFKIAARGFKSIQFDKYGERVITDLSELKKEDLEILYFKSEGDIRILECTRGVLYIEYLNEEIFDDRGMTIPPQKIYKAAQNYWDNFEKGRMDP